MSLFRDGFTEHQHVLSETLHACEADFIRLAKAAIAAVKRGNKILLFGNGGSAADAQHIAAELVGKYLKDREPIPAIALTTDTSVLTAIGNDMDFEEIFARQVHALGWEHDLAIGISTSGRSRNVIRGLQLALEMGMGAAALGGGDGGSLRELANPLILVPSNSTPRIQEMHILIGHLLCQAIEEECGK